ncbi:hypothetical protein INR49_010123 [Caranx melampygus]|nr:hypothetical protein INR49_010123 [Caranx melampygus]
MSLREKVVHENLKTALSNPHMIFVLLTPSKMTSPGSTHRTEYAAFISRSRTFINVPVLVNNLGLLEQLSYWKVSTPCSSTGYNLTMKKHGSKFFSSNGLLREALQVEVAALRSRVREKRRSQGGKGVEEEEEDRGREKNLLLQEAVRALFSCSSLFHSQTLTLDAFPVPAVCCGAERHDKDEDDEDVVSVLDTVKPQERLSRTNFVKDAAVTRLLSRGQFTVCVSGSTCSTWLHLDSDECWEAGHPNKRVSSRKRSRGSLHAHLTPARKKRGGEGGAFSQQCPTDRRISIMAQIQPAEYCSDTEDLFGDYDSLLEDSSLLAKLDDAEQYNLTDSILDGLGDEPFENLPSSQVQFEEQVDDHVKRSRLQDGGQTSTPFKDSGGMTEERGGRREEEKPRRSRGRRSVADQLKRTMLGNAASPSNISRTAVLKQAVVSEEISVAVQAMETVSAETPDLGPFYGLPSKVKDLMHKLRGISSLYDWQETCLNLDCVQQRRNLIYSLPTSGGKTLVAEILILRELLCRKKDCLFILPYISLVQEKVRGLASFGLELDFMVEEYAGSKGKFPPVKRRNKSSLYVATIEKGHSLVNSLIEAGRLENLGLLVVDELHMLGDGGRGAVIEMTLAKVLFMSKKTQIIGMSATLGNIRDLQTFLQADNYTNDFRPVQLKEFVKLNDTIYEVDPKEEDCFRFSRLLNYKYSSAMQKMDPDHIIALVTEVIPAHSCLVFCPTKKNCENVAGMICKYLKEDFLRHREAEKAVLLKELRDSGGGSLCPVLRRTVPFGLAYHHSGLTTEERRLVEEAYSNGVLCLLTCTSTLAAGINLPARRGLTDPSVSSTPQSHPSVSVRGVRLPEEESVQQMVGRAGRAGIDSVGESILILQNKDRDMAKTLVCAPMENCYSNLMQDGGKGLLSLILSLIGLNMCTSVEQVGEFLKGTLLSVQQTELCVDQSLSNVVTQCVDELTEKKLVTVTMQDLSRGLEALMLNSYLHLVYLVTPYDLVSQVKPDWMVYFRQFTLLSAAEQRMSAAVGVPESFVARKAAGQTVKNSADPAVACRMYLALVLFSLLKETDLWLVSSRFQLSRGFVQTLLSSSSAFCSCVLHFTEELEELWPFRALLTELTRRLSYCVKAELIPLMEVTGVMECRAKQLYDAGYRTLTHLANADPALLSRSIENLYRKQANQIVASAKMLLSEKASALQEEVDELLAPPTDLPTAEGVGPHV